MSAELGEQDLAVGMRAWMWKLVALTSARMYLGPQHLLANHSTTGEPRIDSAAAFVCKCAEFLLAGRTRAPAQRSQSTAVGWG